jgi:hypothetical protein
MFSENSKLKKKSPCLIIERPTSPLGGEQAPGGRVKAGPFQIYIDGLLKGVKPEIVSSLTIMNP